MITFLDLCGVAVFAISGALAAGHKNMDVFGVLVLACVTAVGGGTLRDLVLAQGPVFWVSDPRYIAVAGVAGLSAFVAARRFRAAARALLVADAFGLALFSVLGTEKALAAGTSPLIAVLLGMLSGVAGGMIRDVLCGEVPLILRREIYATAALVAAGTTVVATSLAVGPGPTLAAGVASGLALRLAAIHFRLALPVLRLRDD